MRALIQRVLSASVEIKGNTTASIDHGLLILLGIGLNDTESDIEYVVNKTINLRIFSDDSGKFNLSALDTNAQILLVSQFTLYADTRRGRRPSFLEAAKPEDARNLFNKSVDVFTKTGLNVETGQFQESMLICSKNDGPVTIMIDSADRATPKRSPDKQL